MWQGVRVANATRVLAWLCLFVHGCTSVDGGAVELSWKLRSASGSLTDFLECSNVPTLEAIQLDWEVGSDAKTARWPCELGHAVTGFDLPQGQALLSVKPVCTTGNVAASGTFVAPAPELRQVIVGNTISLGAVELVLRVPPCSPCICQ